MCGPRACRRNATYPFAPPSPRRSGSRSGRGARVYGGSAAGEAQRPVVDFDSSVTSSAHLDASARPTGTTSSRRCGVPVPH
jgi:hypothetical protein